MRVRTKVRAFSIGGKMANSFEGIKKQKFGVEIECTGLTRAAAAKAAQKVLGGNLNHFGGSYDSCDT